ncbi:MAG TPA: hypothetical protein VHB79_34320 [Polyangiaceae bacterium]|nr:hypothetical protein [Polyangiaceae bacterium]
MRVKYGELSAEERSARAGAQRTAREAWLALREGDSERAEELLASVDERLALELELSANGEQGVAAITSNDASAWPLAELILAEAPPDLGYALSLGRAPRSLDDALAEIREAYDIELTRATVRAGFGRGHLLEVTLGVPGGTGSEIEQNAAENLVLSLLGERLFETWIGAVHVTPAPRGGSLRVLDVNAPRHELTLRELLATVTAASLGALRGLPPSRRVLPIRESEQPLTEHGDIVVANGNARDDWALLEMEPASEVGALDKSDLVLASTCTPELLRCYLEGSPCSSQRFTRDGERFVYVAYVDPERSMSKRVAKRTAIEMALSDLVTDAIVTGVGLGASSSYLDLALFNLETGLPRLVSKLRELELPRRSLIKFFDTELADEWLNIWPDTDTA